MALADPPGPGAAGRAARVPLALLLGTGTAVAELIYLVLAGIVALGCVTSARGRRAATRLILAGAQRLAALEVRRLRLMGAAAIPVPGWENASALGSHGRPRREASVEPQRYEGRRALAYVAARWPVGVLGGIVLLLLVLGLGTGAQLAWGWALGENYDGIPPTPPILLYLGVAGIVLLFLDVTGMFGVAALERALARRLLGPSTTELLERRIAELAESRAGIVAAVDQERRRIERDLHDGLQQRLVALAMLIGRARRGRSPELLDALLLQAHEAAREAIGDLREVAWRVYPTGLDSSGLRDALATVAEHAAVPVEVRYDLAERPAPTIETAAYFVVCEAVTNAAKHANARLITVHLARRETMIVVRVHDDGQGGADPAGSGLSGLARRVAALDGRFHLQSPAGGPTTVVAELPCE
ncbi:sensor histidine kinase [Sphaerisporangium perillae]|uniref:sensor histidine kinase n=1 Tax=Sphaerisporangium perillae TaxID=2935860 RepID=UPI00200F4EF7|nr:histidine kinase [Sphaerisporangium perillae]